MNQTINHRQKNKNSNNTFITTETFCCLRDLFELTVDIPEVDPSSAFSSSNPSATSVPLSKREKNTKNKEK